MALSKKCCTIRMDCIGTICWIFGSSLINLSRNTRNVESAKFYEPPVDSKFSFNSFTSSNLELVDSKHNEKCQVYQKRPLSARNTAVKFYNPSWDVIPKPNHTLNGDWILRYSNQETNFNPWPCGDKFGYFALVPWRQRMSRTDLINLTAWEPTNNRKIYYKQMKQVKKFEMKRMKRLLRKQINYKRNRRNNNNVKIRILFCIELNKRKRLKTVEMYEKNLNMLKSEQLNKNQQVIEYENNSAVDKVYSVQVKQKQQYRHWGYFSQRNKGVDECLIDHSARKYYTINVMNGTNARLDYRCLFAKFNEFSSNKFNRSIGGHNYDFNVKNVLCKKCQR